MRYIALKSLRQYSLFELKSYNAGAVAAKKYYAVTEAGVEGFDEFNMDVLIRFQNLDFFIDEYNNLI